MLHFSNVNSAYTDPGKDVTGNQEFNPKHPGSDRGPSTGASQGFYY